MGWGGKKMGWTSVIFVNKGIWLTQIFFSKTLIIGDELSKQSCQFSHILVTGRVSSSFRSSQGILKPFIPFADIVFSLLKFSLSQKVTIRKCKYLIDNWDQDDSSV